MFNTQLAAFSGPALVAPDQGPRVEACLRGMSASKVFAEISERPMSAGSDDFWPDEDDGWMKALRPYTVIDGVLQIPVRGVLLHDFPYQLFDWATGYKYLEKAFKRGMEDANVQAIALILDSPGGMVAGCFDAVDRMQAANTGKPVRAFAAEMACSAAYAIACIADTITVSRTGYVGSVGVVTSHSDWSKFYEDYGIKITFIHAGKYKVDGNSTQPLPDAAKARIQAHVDELYGIFVASVAKNRNLEEQAVRDTEALVYSASEALAVGFADSIGALDEELAEWSAALNIDHGDYTMSKTTPAADNAAEAQAANEAAIATAVATATAEGQKAGATAERARISGILSHEAATGRSAAAQKIALTTDLTVEQATDLLASLPAETAPAAAAPKKVDTLATLMGASPAPNLAGEPEGGAVVNDDDAIVARILTDSGRTPGKSSREKS